MKKPENKAGRPGGGLRRKAEQAAKKLNAAEPGNLPGNVEKPESGKGLTMPEVSKLIQDLQLYQIELEMQNEALQQTSEELIYSARKYEDLYDFAPVSYVSLDKNALIAEANLASSVLFQLDRRQLLSRRLAAFVEPDCLDDFYRFHRKVLTTDVKQTAELAFRRTDNSVFWARLLGVTVRNDKTTESHCRLALLDITETKEAEKKLLESRNFVARVAEATPDIITVYDLETRRNIYVNRELQAFLGFSNAELQQTEAEALLSLIHPEDRQPFAADMARLQNLAEGELYEFEYRLKNAAGQYRWLRNRSLVFQRNKAGRPKEIISIQQDITDRKQAEEELRIKNQIIDGLLKNLPVVVTRFSPDGTILNAAGKLSPLLSPAQPDLLSPAQPDLRRQNIYQLMPDKADLLQDIFHEKPASFESELHVSGGTRYFQNYYFRDPAHNWATGFAIDITEQVAAKKQARADRSFSDNVLNSSVDGIIAFDMDTRITAWNRVMEVTTRKRREDVLGKRLFEVFPEFENRSEGQAVARVLAGERVALYNQTFNQKGMSYEMHLNPLDSGTGKIKGGLCILHNVSAQKKLEEESTRLKLSQQKSILNAILEAQEQERKRIAEALHNGLGQLLYAVKLHMEETKADPAETKKQIRKLIDEAIQETRTLSFELVPGILADFGLETALQELLKRIGSAAINLHISVSGTVKRLPETVEIGVYRMVQELINNILKHSKAKDAWIYVIYKRNRLKIIAEDNGLGFDYGNEKPHKGFGLSSIKNRLKLLEGSLKIDSRAGEGTIINIEFKVPPVHDKS